MVAGTNVYVTDWSRASATRRSGVSAVLMHNNVYNEFVARADDQVGHRLGRDDADEALLHRDRLGQQRRPLFQRNFNGNRARATT